MPSVPVMDSETSAEKTKELQSFLDANKPAYFELMTKYTDLFNQIGKETNDEAIQLGFAGTVIFNVLNSIQCEKTQKEQLLKNILAKL
jgi:hypothetical protein